MSGSETGVSESGELLPTSIQFVVGYLKAARVNFDQFNLDVAQLRANKGMSDALVRLYSLMGVWDKNIIELISDAERIAAFYNRITSRAPTDKADLPKEDLDSSYFADDNRNGHS